VHLCANGGMDSICADQDTAGDNLHTRRCFNAGGHTAIFFDLISRHPAAEPDRIGAGKPTEPIMQRQLEGTTVGGVLRPSIPGRTAAGFGVDLLAIQPDKGPFPNRNPKTIKVGFGKPELQQFANSVWLKVDANAKRFHLPDLFDDKAGHANLMQGQRQSQPTNATASDDHTGLVATLNCHVHPPWVQCFDPRIDTITASVTSRVVAILNVFTCSSCLCEYVDAVRCDG